MMKQRLIKWIGIVGCLLGMCACGMLADDDKDIEAAFQDNGPLNTDNPDAGFRVLEVFDGRGSLEEIWDSIDAKQTNPRLTCTVDHLTDDFVTFSNVAAGILRHESQPLSLLLSENTAVLLGLVRDESAPFFVESPPDIGAFYTQLPADYADAFYAFLDALWEGDQRPGDQHMVAMARKVVQRMLDKKDALTILADMQELIDDIGEAEFDRDFNDLASLLGKLMIRADYPLWIDDSGNPVNRDAINPALDDNLGVGNAVSGVNTLVNWMNTMMADPTARSFFYAVIRETAAVFDPNDASPNADKVKTLIQTLESHFTESGDVYTADPRYSTDTAAIYSDTELGLTVREFMPYLAQLLARSDRDISMVDTSEGAEPVYLLREMVDALHGIGFDPDSLSVEDSITMMMQHDLLGRDRTDENSDAFPASMLESLVFLTGATTHFGFADGGASGETAQASNPITQHGHGAYTEAMTLNDSLISMTTSKTLNLLGLYDISLKNTDKNYLSRSNVPFTTANRSDYQYDVNQNYPILRALAGPSSGDYGTPDGGNRTGQVPAQNQYTPFNPTGVGETQLAAWTVNWAVRSCFGGEGPYYYADPDADTVTVGGRTYTKYLRPDGRVYALVNKDNPVSWEYLYPTDERDAEDPDTEVLDYNGLRQRFNRYKSTWHSDYYMYYRTDGISAIRRTVDNSSGNLNTATLAVGDPAQRLTYHELIPEDDPTHMRACASPEEAFFRNYQWVYTEKKMVLIIPQSLDLSVLGFGSVFMILEAHGWSGLANMRIFEDNHVWAKKGTDGASDIPGDYRVEVKVDMTLLASAAVNSDSVYDTTLGKGHATPAIVGKNLPALYRLAFPVNNGVGGIDLGSREFEVGDAAWQNRNAVAPLFISLLQAIDKHRVAWPDYDRDSLKNGIVSMTNNLAPLLKPLIYYSDTADGTNPKQCWKLRVQTAPNGETWNGEPYLRPSVGFGGTVRWDGTDDEWLHYQPRQMKTLLNVLIDSDMTAPPAEGKRMDGILPVLTGTRTMTNLFKVLMSEANDSNDLYSALEQILGAVRFTEGRMTEINRNPAATKKVPFPDWMFAVGSGADDHGFYTGFTDVRDEDIVLDVGLDRLIGFEGDDGYGLVNYVAEQGADWTDFHDTMDLLEDLLHPSSDYSLVESFIAMQDAIFARETRYSDEQVAGLVYTLGKLFTRYDTGEGRWLVQGEAGFADLFNIFKVRLPAVHDLVKDDTGENYRAALTVNADMLSETNACGTNGMIPYLLDAMSTEDSAEEILGDLHTFLTDDIVSEPRPLWSTLANLLQDMATAVDASKDGRLIEEVFSNYGFQQNGEY